MCKHKHSLSVSPYILPIEDKIKDVLANWLFFRVFIPTLFVLLQLCLHTRSMNISDPTSSGQSLCETNYWSLMPIHCRHQGSEDQVPSRLPRGQGLSWSSSESALTFIHLGACCSHTQCKLIFVWMRLLSPHLLASVGLCTSVQVTQKAWWSPHQ